MTLAERLLARLRRELPPERVPADAWPVSVRAGRAARNAGAWSWCLMSLNGNDYRVGSQWSMSVLVTAPHWSVSLLPYGDLAIDPDPLP